jgi:hypothetical protein
MLTNPTYHHFEENTFIFQNVLVDFKHGAPNYGGTYPDNSKGLALWTKHLIPALLGLIVMTMEER